MLEVRKMAKSRRTVKVEGKTIDVAKALERIYYKWVLAVQEEFNCKTWKDSLTYYGLALGYQFTKAVLVAIEHDKKKANR